MAEEKKNLFSMSGDRSHQQHRAGNEGTIQKGGISYV